MSTPQLLPVRSIVVAPGHNPRRHFKQAEFDRLVESIRDNGLISPITVRPSPSGEGYELVAGERRLRALRALNQEQVPALVRELDDAQAHQLALLENLDRSDLAPVEEALVAQRHVDAYEGDHDAAARALGWPLQRLRHRLRLLHCTPEVLDALVEERLTLGHAELLATLPAEQQGKALPRILSEGISVADLKEQLQGFSTPLSQAIFDREVAGCATCPHNSSCQRELFATHIAEARCTNRPCFTRLTNEALEAKRATLKEEFGTVSLLTEKVPGATIPLVQFGDTGVGAAAFAACRGCKHFGAVLDDRLGATTGRVDQPLCFDRGCHSTKVADYQATLAPPPAPDSVEAAPGASEPSTAKPKPAPAAAGKKPAANHAKATPGAVADQYAAILRRAVSSHAQSDPVTILSLALYALMRVAADEVGRNGVEAVAKALGLPAGKSRSSTGKQNSIPLALLALDKPALQQGIVGAALHLLNENPDEQQTVFHGKLHRRALVASIAARKNLDLLPFIRIDSEFLAAHTKAGIEQILDESGFTQWMKDQPDGSKRLKALLASGKGDLVKGVIEAAYPGFATYVPSALIAQSAAWQKLA